MLKRLDVQHLGGKSTAYTGDLLVHFIANVMGYIAQLLGATIDFSGFNYGALGQYIKHIVAHIVAAIALLGIAYQQILGPHCAPIPVKNVFGFGRKRQLTGARYGLKLAAAL